MHEGEGDEENPAGIIDSIFGFESIFSKKEFIKEVSTKEKNQWIVDDSKIRNKMLTTFGT